MTVRFTLPAQADLQRIYSYLSNDNRIEASRLVARLVELAWSLADNPDKGRSTDEPSVRVLVVPRLHYFIFYRIKADEIHITHIRHTARRRPPGWSR